MKNYTKKNFKKLEKALKIINTGKLITRFMTRYYNQPPGKVKTSHKNLWGWEPVLIGNKETLVGNLRECLKKDKSKKKYYDEAVKCDCVKVMSLKKFSRKMRTIDRETLKLAKKIDKYLLRIGYGKDTNLGQHRVMLMDMSYNFKDGTNIYQVMRDCGYGVFFNGIQTFDWQPRGQNDCKDGSKIVCGYIGCACICPDRGQRRDEFYRVNEQKCPRGSDKCDSAAPKSEQKPIPNPATITKPSETPKSNYKATGAWAGNQAVTDWCNDNCRLGNCPPTHCTPA